MIKTYGVHHQGGAVFLTRSGPRILPHRFWIAIRPYLVRVKPVYREALTCTAAFVPISYTAQIHRLSLRALSRDSAIPLSDRPRLETTIEFSRGISLARAGHGFGERGRVRLRLRRFPLAGLSQQFWNNLNDGSEFHRSGLWPVSGSKISMRSYVAARDATPFGIGSRALRQQASAGRPLSSLRYRIGGEGGIRTLEGLLTLTPLAGARLRPLGHLSGFAAQRPSRSAG
jgi:hypothetical protein